MFSFLFGRKSRQYGDLTPPRQKQKDWESDPHHKGPSGEAYAYVREQVLAPGEVEGYMAQVRKNAAELGISDFEVWRKETPDGSVVTYGTKNSLDQACMLIRMHGDEGGRQVHRQNFENMSPEETKKWINAAKKLLDENGIPYEVRQTGNDRVEFTFDSSANHNAFNVAVDRGLVDRMAQGEDTGAEFAGLRNTISANARRRHRTQCFDMN